MNTRHRAPNRLLKNDNGAVLKVATRVTEHDMLPLPSLVGVEEFDEIVEITPFGRSSNRLTETLVKIDADHIRLKDNG
jgi:hypothetical protein